MQPAAWPARDAEIVERQSALLERVAADRARAFSRAAAAAAVAAQDDPSSYQGRRGFAAGAIAQPRLRQIDLLTGEQWPAPLADAQRLAAVSPHAVALTTTCQKPPLRTRPVASIELPSSSLRQTSPVRETGVGVVRAGAAAPSWHTRPPAAAMVSCPKDGGPESSLDAAPSDFLCPISHEIMLEPVLIETGCTFERDALCRWWAQSDVRRCPLTGVVVQNAVMAPADELRRQICAWAARNGVDLRAVAQERIRAAAADEAQRSERVLVQPSGQSATAAAPGTAKVKQAAVKASKKARRHGAARRGGCCCCCSRSSDVLA